MGVISAQKKMLRLLTAWEENIPIMEKAMEKFLFSVPELSSADKAEHTHTHDNSDSFQMVKINNLGKQRNQRNYIILLIFRKCG